MQWRWRWVGTTAQCGWMGNGVTSSGYRIIEIDQIGTPTSGGTVVELNHTTNSTIGLPDVDSPIGIAPAIGFIVTGDGIPNNTRIQSIDTLTGNYRITLNNSVTSTDGTTLTLSPYIGTITSGSGVTRTISYYIT